jgi:protein required for attachment to host cells
MAEYTLDGQAGPALVAVGDSARLRLFRCDRPHGALEEIGDLVNPEARLHEGDLVADSAGRLNRRPLAPARSAYGGDSMRRHRVEDFAGTACKRIAGALRETGADRLYLVAEPSFLGLLRQRMAHTVQRQVAGQVPKALVDKSPEAIRTVLPQRL